MSSENASTSPSAVRDRDNHLKGSDHSPGSADVQSGELISLLDTIRSSRGQAAALRIRGEQMLVERQQREPLTRRLFESAGVESDSVKLESVAATPPTSIERPRCGIAHRLPRSDGSRSASMLSIVWIFASCRTTLTAWTVHTLNTMHQMVCLRPQTRTPATSASTSRFRRTSPQ